MAGIRLADLQAEVDEYIGQFEEGYWHPLANLARLAEEVGELARWLNHFHGEKTVRAEEARAAERRQETLGVGPVAEELGDILFVLACIANDAGISLDESFGAVMEKVQTRDASRWTPKKRDECDSGQDV